jgi:CRP-like cAMP-binding protein
VASNSFLASKSSGVFKGQVIGSPKQQQQQKKDNGSIYLNHDEINRRAIQIFHTEGGESNALRSSKKRVFTIIHPYDRFRRMFDVTTVVWVLLLVFFIPMEIGFDWYETVTWQKVLFTALDIWFALDIMLNFRTGYINHGTVVMDSKKIASHYLSTWFLVDLLGTLPFEQLMSTQVSSRKSLKLAKYFKIPKLLRISRVMKYVRNHQYVYDFSKVLILIFTLMHIGACVWVMLLDPCNETKSNYAGADVCAQSNVYHIYAEALHISASMMLGVSNLHIIGKPHLLSLDFEGRDDDSAKVFLISTLYMILGLFLIALLVSEVNVYVMGKMQGSAAFQRKTDRVNHEMEYYGVPDDLQRQVRAFYDYIWIHQKQYDDKIALLSDQQMSTDLQRKLALHLFKDVVSHISFFSEIDDLLLGEICMSLRTKVFLPGDMILFKGDVGKELFIISKGVVEVLRDDLPRSKRRDAPQILLRNGSFFGEIALVMEVRRTCSVQARTVCEVNILQQNAFDAILLDHPQFARRMNELVVARQLDSCMARSHQKGVDFQVSQSDMDLAVMKMEKNMKEGLERRQMQDSSRSLGSSKRQKSDVMDNTVFPTTRVSFDGSVKMPLPPSRTRGGHDEESQLSDPPNCQMKLIQNIARRSTRFPNEEEAEGVEEVSRRAVRPFTDNTNGASNKDVIDDVIDACSDVKLEATKGRKRGRPAHTKYNGGEEDGDDLCSRLTGHFNPGIQVVDVSKVNPIILNSLTHKARRFVECQIEPARTADGEIIGKD